MTIVYEDEEILVISKPSGITVNRADTTRYETTVQDWVEEYLRVSKVPQVPGVSQGEKTHDTLDTFDTRDTFYQRAGIVHRLDKETSGILLIAKTPEAFENLQKQFKDRVVEKTYQALAHGFVAPETGEIKAPIGRLPWNRKRFGILPEGRESLTRYRTLKNYQLSVKNEELTLLELYPQTGRTHQIRVHLKYIGHSVFADELYAGRKTARDDRKLLKRLFLHAAKISFLHPKKRTLVELESPLPEELSSVLSQLS